MKHISQMITASVLLLLTACKGGMSANQTSSAASSRAPASSVFMTTASESNGLVPLIRYSTSHGHLSQPYSSVQQRMFPNENIAQTPGFEGGLVMVSENPGPGLHPVWSCINWMTGPGGVNIPLYFTSADSHCEGQTYAISYPFYLSDTPTPTMSRVLYRCVQPNTADHLDTTDLNECAAAGFVYEGGLGYGG